MKPPNTYLSESIKNIDKLSTAVRQHLGISSGQLSLFVLARQQKITLMVDSPVFASQLKYQQNDILRFINKHFLSQFKEIKVRISPAVMRRPIKIAAPKPLSNDICQLLDAVRNELDR